jgi:hypothetical protein
MMGKIKDAKQGGCTERKNVSNIVNVHLFHFHRQIKITEPEGKFDKWHLDRYSSARAALRSCAKH